MEKRLTALEEWTYDRDGDLDDPEGARAGMVAFLRIMRYSEG
jgi:hypothetical protein